MQLILKEIDKIRHEPEPGSTRRSVVNVDKFYSKKGQNSVEWGL